MKQAKWIRYNERLYTIAPSFGVTTSPYKERYEKTKYRLERLGYTVVEGENVHLNEGVLSSNTPELRAKEFMDAYLNEESNVLFSVGGGETMCDILPFIDFERIKEAQPKWFIGYSDNTNLTFTLTTICDVISIYGPCFTTYYEKPMRLGEKQVFDLLKGEKHLEGFEKYSGEVNNPKSPFHRLVLRKEKKIISQNFEKEEGILVGGCLDCLLTICGTKYDHMKEFNERHEDNIFFLEACDLNPLQIRRGLFQLKEAGWFKNTKAFIFGRPLCLDRAILGVNKFTAVTDILGKEIPILFDVDLGHIPPMVPIKCGARCVVSYHDNNIFFDYQE